MSGLVIKKYGVESVYDFDDANGDSCSISQYDDGDVEFCFDDGCLLTKQQVIDLANHLLEISSD